MIKEVLVRHLLQAKTSPPRINTVKTPPKKANQELVDVFWLAVTVGSEVVEVVILVVVAEVTEVLEIVDAAEVVVEVVVAEVLCDLLISPWIHVR